MTRSLSLLYVAFLFSGASGLIYQTVWVRMLTRHLGATTHAMAIVLAVFMGGLAVGSYFGGRWADRGRRLLLTYAILEAGIAVAAMAASFLGVPLLAPLYVAAHRVTDAGGIILAQTLFSVACLLPATVLMGATLPVLTAFLVRLDPRFERSFGRLYSINTWGAVAGVVATGYVLLGLVGETACLVIAFVANLVAAGLAYGLRETGDVSVLAPSSTSTSSPRVESPVSASTTWRPYSPLLRKCVLVTIFASGFTALAYEVLWTRLLTPILETSIYAFSGMLATFLIGIATGSWSASRHGDSGSSPIARFAMLEIWIGCLAALALLVLPWIDPLGAAAGVDMTALSLRNWIWKAVACAVILFPLAFCFGKQFPVAVRCFLLDVDRPADSTGRAYAANTLGGIAGCFAAGFALVPLFGSATSMVLLAGMNVALGILLLTLTPVEERKGSGWRALPLTCLFLLAAASVGDPYYTMMRARLAEPIAYGPDVEIYHYSETSAGSTIAVGTRGEPLRRGLMVNAVAMTNLVTETKLMAHLPYVLAEDPQRMLVICFGMGTTVRSGSRHPGLEIDAVDLAPSVFDCFGYFHADADEIAARETTRFHAQDGRHFLLVTEGRYDVVNVDAAPPLHSAGTVNLYSREFFELCKSHLTPGGVFCLWLPPSNESEIKMIMRTFVEVFPGAALWGGLGPSGFYLLGGRRSMDLSPSRRTEVLKRLAAMDDLAEWSDEYVDLQNLEELFLLGSEDLARFVADSPVVTDDRPYTEFPIWRRIFVPSAKRILHANHVRDLASP